MKRALVLLVLLATACKRDATPPPVTDPAVATPGSAAANDPWGASNASKKPVELLKRPFLWSIEKDGHTSYALGTMHVGVDPERLPKHVWDKVTAARAFAMETDSADASMLDLGRRTSGSLREDLGPDYWAKLEKLIEPQMLAALDKQKPVMAAVFLSMRGIELSGLVSMDMSLMARAQGAGKPVITLEPASKQAALLDKWMNVKTLKMMIDTADTGLENTKALAAAYVAGDDARMVSLFEGQKADALKHGYTEAEYDEQNADMLWDRNASWIPAIEEMHAKGGGFIAVGALHLVGKKSVLELLAAKGYKIQRVE